MTKKWTQTVIFIVAVVSGVLNYDGLSSLVAPDDWWLKSVCAMTGVAVALSLSLFWNWAFETLPDLKSRSKRIVGWLVVWTGLSLIVSLSSYWNVASLTRSEIDRLAERAAVERVEYQYNLAVRSIQKSRSVASDISSLHSDTLTLQEMEVSSGGTSASAGEGAISNTMGQVAGRVHSVVKALQASTNKVDQLQSKGDQCLDLLRVTITSGNIDKAGEHLSCVNGVIAQMAGQDVLTSTVRGLENLTAGIVLPANIKTKSQRDIIDGFITESQEKANKIAKSVGQIEQGKLPEPLTLERPNIMRGVLEYWQSILPAIATALGLDLLPLIILMFKTLLRDERDSKDDPRNHWTAVELIDAAKQLKMIDDFPQKPGNRGLDVPDYIDFNPGSIDTNNRGQLGDGCKE
ncbi:hypothetical protein TRICHSKD4_2363 [Roseibium sp. TrichSKD4]|uniref:hypothetical protein n=1 Tax=Roseibium sp. TrichSKD4 TaxID=744980 RepID=UPI0001E56AE9|nr:hypothetical protein [Roseibium sp. TrichSKD4]EFO32561.1 hypothetical protein TRICHSKD4_2363 [Roseibium sp. TrichSKD4]